VYWSNDFLQVVVVFLFSLERKKKQTCLSAEFKHGMIAPRIRACLPPLTLREIAVAWLTFLLWN